VALLALLVGACGRSPRVVTVSPTPDGLRPDASRVTDYPEALAVIVPAMRDVLGLGLPQGAALEIHADRDGFARALVKAFGVERPRARDLAGWVQAAASGRRVLVNEVVVAGKPWPERIEIIAHELTHTIQHELAGRRRSTSDSWLFEGFAEWVALRVADALGLRTFAGARETYVVAVRTAAAQRRLPSPRRMATPQEWIAVRLEHGFEATYGLAFLAADFLVDRHSRGAVVEYFRRFATSEDRLANFEAAFGQPLEAFEADFTAHVDRLRRSSHGDGERSISARTP
jgi:hypothetical protein